MNIFFISDLHLGHKNIIKFSRDYRVGLTIEEHNEWLVSQWNSVVGKGDIVYVLGDVAFGHENLKYLDQMKGQKFLIRGNHDGGDISVFKPYFQNIYGLLKYKGFWLSHAPIHPASLRNLFNLHGHVHQNTLEDLRYINVSVEALNGIPISLDTLKLMVEDRRCLLNINQTKQPNITGALIADTTETSED